MNLYTVPDARLVEDPARITTRKGSELVKIRCVDNPISTENGATPRFFDALIGRDDLKNTAMRLKKGDVITIWGALIRREWTSDGSGKTPKGETRITDEMPFVENIRVQRSPSFFERSDAAPGATGGNNKGGGDIPF